MYQVGTDVGNVHKLREGEGLAEKLVRGPEIAYAYALDDKFKARADKKKAARDAALAKINAGNEYWYKNEQELGARVKALRESGARIVADGIEDPFSSQDERAIAFRREYDDVASLANSSMQMKKAYETFRTDIDGKDPNEFNDDDITKSHEYFNSSLKDVRDKGLLPPPLMKKRAYKETFEFIGKNMGVWSKDWAGNIPDDAKTFDFVKALVDDPANRADVVRSYGSKYVQLAPDEKQDIDDRAKQMSVEPHVVMAVDDGNRWKRMQERFEPLTLLAKAAKTVEGGVDYSTNATPNTRSVSYNKGDLAKGLETVVLATFNSDPRWMDYYEDKVERHPTEKDGEYAARVRDRMKKDIEPLVSLKKEYALTDRGKDDQEFTTRRNDWIRDLRSGDPVLAQAAAQWIVNSKVFGNLNVEEGVIRQGPSGRVLGLTTRTNLTLDRVKADLAGKLPGEVVDGTTIEERQGVRTISIPIGENEIANQMLAELYDVTYKLRNKQNYDTKISETAIPRKIDEPVSSSDPQRNVPLVTKPKAASLFGGQ